MQVLKSRADCQINILPCYLLPHLHKALAQTAILLSFFTSYKRIPASQPSTPHNLQSGSGALEGTKDKVCAAIMESVEANDAFMNSIVEEHRCMRQYYNTCADVGSNICQTLFLA